MLYKLKQGCSELDLSKELNRVNSGHFGGMTIEEIEVESDLC